jgi:hypothetical protein
VNRGGSWNNDAANCCSSNRNNNSPDNRNNNIGFRLAPAPPASVGAVTFGMEPDSDPGPEVFHEIFGQRKAGRLGASRISRKLRDGIFLGHSQG